MQTPRRYGIIDMGSNAIRMLVVELQQGTAQTLHKHRAALRLGDAVYQHGHLPEALMEEVVATLQEMQQRFAEAQVDEVRAIATAAVREADNGDHLVARIAQSTGIQLEVISGQREADLLRLAMQRSLPACAGRSLLLDLGGGSVEVVSADSHQGRGVSLPLGALRLLQEIRQQTEQDHGPEFMQALRQAIEARRPQVEKLIAKVQHQRFAACGGSLETLAKLIDPGSKKKKIREVTLDDLQTWSAKLGALPIPTRMQKHGLPKDRADTVVPASLVTLCIGSWIQAQSVMVPRVDLRDGLLQEILTG